MVLVVAYDLHAPGRDYDAISKLLKSADNGWAHFQGSVWLLDTQQQPEWWRDELKKEGDANDEYFVSRLSRNWAGFNGGKELYDWLKAPNRTW